MWLPCVLRCGAFRRRRPPLPGAERVKIAHLGTITSAGGPLYILTVGDTQYELTRGDSAGRFAFTACDGDSLYLCKDGVTYGVKRCGP